LNTGASLLHGILLASLTYPFAEIGDHQYLSWLRIKASQGFSNFVDGSGHIFSMYLEMATEEDKKMTENWKADANGIPTFVRHQFIF
jgi:phage protein U